jgi:hypothetical protein
MTSNPRRNKCEALGRALKANPKLNLSDERIEEAVHRCMTSTPKPRKPRRPKTEAPASDE